MKAAKKVLSSCLLATLFPGAAQAAGYDTPVLYSARHMGMGGTAIGYVNDPSAIFHNPAGLGAIRGGAVLGNFSPILASIKGSPSDHQVTDTAGNKSKPGTSVWSERAFSPAFLVGAAYNVLDRITFGAAVYPVASAGGRYVYTANKGKEVVEVTDFTRLVFMEYAPSLAVEVVKGLRVGAAFRYLSAQFQRKRSNPDDKGVPSNVDLDMKGTNTEGFRLGLQYEFGDLSVGAVYRNRTDTPVTAATGMLENTKGKDITYAFVIPAKFGFGAQYKGIDKLRLALDVEYTQQSDNVETTLKGTGLFDTGDPAKPLEVPVEVKNISKWQDNFTVRVGGGYTLGSLEARLGYLFDGQASQARFVSAFGTPPTSTHAITAGAGYKVSDTLDVSLAAAYRTGSTSVTEADVKGNGCAFCGKAGDYELQVFGGYLDVCWRFGQTAKPAPEPAPAAAPEPAPAVEPAAAASPSTP
ncbi:MAG: porin [Deltaproteobacteria bacterium]|nr:porin [Deltaproteobacteria bacterium]